MSMEESEKNKMSTEPKRIRVNANTKLEPILEEAKKSPILLEKDGITYRLNAEEVDDIWGGYDPEKVRAALASTAGSWADMDTDTILSNLYRARMEGSRPISRPQWLTY